MKSVLFQTICITTVAFILSGCTSDGSAPATGAQNGKHGGRVEIDPEREAAFAKLSDSDRPLAIAQGYCAVTSHPLGTMGTPIKLNIGDEPVFVCCKGCEKKAQSSPKETLEKVAELKSKVKEENTK